MIRRLLQDGVFYAISSGIPAALGLVLLPFYTRRLGPHEYGLLDATTVVLTLVTIVATVETSQGLVRFLPEAKTQDERRRIGSTALWFTVATLAAVALVMGLAAPAIATSIFGEPSRTGVVRAGAIALVAAGLQGIATRHLRASLRARDYALAVAVTNVLTAVAAVALLLRWKPAAEAMLIGQAIGNLAGAGVSAWFARGEIATPAACDAATLRLLLVFSAPLVLSSLGDIAATQVGRLLLARVGSLEEAGVFGIAARLAAILALLASGLQLAIGPLIYSSHREPGTPEALAGALRVFAAVALTGWMLLVAFAGEIVALLAADRFAPAQELVAPLGAAVVLSSAIAFAPGLTIKHRTGVFTAICVASGAVNLVLCWLVIGRWGPMGAAWATLAAGALQTSLFFVFSQKHYPVPHAWSAFVAAAALAALGAFATTRWFTSGTALAWAGKIAVLLAAAGTLAWLLLAPLRTKPIR